MRYRPLGNTGWQVSELGLGTYPLGGAVQTSGSYWSGPATYGAVARDGQAEVLQVPFNLLSPQAAARLLPLAEERGVGIVARVPLASGFLTGTIAEDHRFAVDDYRSFTPREEIVTLVRRARRFSWLVEEGIAGSMPEAALRYILSFPAVSTVIAGAMRREEIEANVAAIADGPLPRDALRRIEAIQRELGLLRTSAAEEEPS